MKIGQNPHLESLAKQPAAPAAQTQAKTAAVAQTVRAATSAGVPVTVSSSARSLEGTATGRANTDIDMAKVQAMRAAIASGTFRINPGVIAERLLGEAAQNLAAAAR